jgi:hypothetical protein
MSTQTLHDGRLQLEAWGLAEFVREFQDLVKDGWYVDLTCNDSYPVNIGGLCHAKLHKLPPLEDFVGDDVISEEKSDTVETPKQMTPKKGRPSEV